MILGFSEINKQTGLPTNFREQILSGVKRHTFRAGNRWKEGAPIQMATGVRTKEYQVFNSEREDLSRCVSVQDAEITVSDTEGSGVHYSIHIDGRKIVGSEAITVAKNDGFTSLLDFLMWFKKESPFKGQLIHWTDLKY